jgi:hypothetical protein
MKWITRLLEIAVVALALLAVGEYSALQQQAQAAIDLVTVPARDSDDITLVKDRRTLTFKKGENKIQFSWANTLIDPTSVELRGVQKEDAFEIEDVSYPPGRNDALIWNIKSGVDGPVAVEISYFTSGITWAADYVALADEKEEKIELVGTVAVVNNSGEDYEDAQTRLIVGTINLVEKIADLARMHWREMPRPAREALRDRYRRFAEEAEDAEGRLADKGKEEMEKPKGIVKEGLSEYFMYTIEGTETVPNTWSKRLPSLRVTDVPVQVIYRYSDIKYGGLVTKFYKFKNRKVEGKKEGEPNLGEEPLPDGMVRVFKRDGEDNLTFIGQCAIKYMPMGEDVELNLGHDPDVLIERKTMDFKKYDLTMEAWGGGRRVVGYTTDTLLKTRVRNTKNLAIQFEIERRFGGDWELKTSQHFDKLDSQTVRFVLQLAPGEEKTFEYTLTQRYGKNAR